MDDTDRIEHITIMVVVVFLRVEDNVLSFVLVSLLIDSVLFQSVFYSVRSFCFLRFRIS